MFWTLSIVAYAILMHLVFIWYIEKLMRQTPTFAGRLLQVLFVLDILLFFLLGFVVVDGFSVQQLLMMLR